ncbi:putative low complexity [Cryptosporidium sp. chipmunk genotype I]|uniref:putative low complexity n=1 Tax=Cryptosporidium sp. chipmunk genotype I TaxID=1280935 RepID=UPI00351A7040|nr:putative low complexity [Cryptosporidium sp. chipmunk genotype I]
MEYLMRREILRNQENNTVKNLLKNLIEMLEMAFQESMMNIDGLVAQQIRNLERYGRFIGSKGLLEEISIHDARRIVHIRHPTYKLNNGIVDKASKLRASLKDDEVYSLEINKLDNLTNLKDLNNSVKSFPKNPIAKNRDEESLILDLLSFEEVQNYEEKYLLSNEIQDYYCYGNYEYNLFFYNFQREHELGILEDFNTKIFDINVSIGSNSNSIQKIRSNSSTNLNSGSQTKGIPNLHLSSSFYSSLESSHYSQSNFKSQTDHIFDSNSNSPTKSILIPEYNSNRAQNISHSWSLGLTSKKTQISEDSSDRLVNRSLTRLKPDQKTEEISINKGNELPEVFETIGYCHTSSFYTVKSLE